MNSVAVDGRTVRTVRTRARIVEATIELVVEENAAPTSRRIAARAGIAERTLYLHFPDLESLHAAVADHHSATVAAAHQVIDPRLSLGDKIGMFARRRGHVLEQMGPLRRVALRFEHESPALQESRRRWAAVARRELERVFGPELAATPDRRTVLAAMEAATSWASWDEWRTAQGLSPRAAVAVMHLTLARLLKR